MRKLSLAGDHVENLLRHAPPVRAWMGKEEQHRCAEMSAQRRLEFTAGRWLLRNVLEREGVIPVGYRVAIGVTGPPALEGIPGVYLSLSHREGRVLAAVADRGVGVDLEFVKPRDVALMAEQVCAPGERQRLEKLDESAALVALHEMWAVKEAAYKAGLTGCPPLAFFRVKASQVEQGREVVSWVWKDGCVAACAADHLDGCDVPAPWGEATCKSCLLWVTNVTATQ